MNAGWNRKVQGALGALGLRENMENPGNCRNLLFRFNKHLLSTWYIAGTHKVWETLPTTMNNLKTEFQFLLMSTGTKCRREGVQVQGSKERVIIIDSRGFPLNYEIFQMYENEKIDAQAYPSSRCSSLHVAKFTASLSIITSTQLMTLRSSQPFSEIRALLKLISFQTFLKQLLHLHDECPLPVYSLPCHLKYDGFRWICFNF